MAARRGLSGLEAGPGRGIERASGFFLRSLLFWSGGAGTAGGGWIGLVVAVAGRRAAGGNIYVVVVAIGKGRRRPGWRPGGWRRRFWGVCDGSEIVLTEAARTGDGIGRR